MKMRGQGGFHVSPIWRHSLGGGSIGSMINSMPIAANEE